MVIRPDAPAGAVRRALAKYVVAKFGEDDWLMLAMETGTEDLVRDHNRLLRSLRFGDDDYLGCVLDVLPDVLGEGMVRVPSGQATATQLPNLRIVEKVVASLEPWLRSNEPQLHAELYGGPTSLAVLDTLQVAADPLSIPEINRHAQRIRDGLAADPEQALGSAKELLETVFKAILDLHGEDKTTKRDLPQLQHAVNVKLGITAQQLSSTDAPGSEQRREMTRALNGIVNAVGQLRNAGFGTGHGGSRRELLDQPTAQLAVTAAVAAATFYAQRFHEHEQQSARRPSLRPRLSRP